MINFSSEQEKEEFIDKLKEVLDNGLSIDSYEVDNGRGSIYTVQSYECDCNTTDTVVTVSVSFEGTIIYETSTTV